MPEHAQPWCRAAALERGGSIAGTAAEARIWIGVEIRETWGPKAPAGCGVEPSWIEWMASATEGWPLARLQLVRRTGAAGPRRVFVAGPNGVRHHAWKDVSDLRALDLRAAAGAELRGEWTDEDAPQYWVCTHGRRDRCCAKWGVAIAQALESLAPGRVWQTSHLGGHRFAPTLITLPTQMVYGHVEPSDVEGLFAATERGHCYNLDRVRGRASWPRSVQAAAVAVRRETGVLETDALRHRGREGDTVLIDVKGSTFAVDVRTKSVTMLASCGDAPKTVDQVEVLALRRL